MRQARQHATHRQSRNRHGGMRQRYAATMCKHDEWRNTQADFALRETHARTIGAALLLSLILHAVAIELLPGMHWAKIDQPLLLTIDLAPAPEPEPAVQIPVQTPTPVPPAPPGPLCPIEPPPFPSPPAPPPAPRTLGASAHGRPAPTPESRPRRSRKPADATEPEHLPQAVAPSLAKRTRGCGANCSRRRLPAFPVNGLPRKLYSQRL